VELTSSQSTAACKPAQTRDSQRGDLEHFASAGAQELKDGRILGFSAYNGMPHVCYRATGLEIFRNPDAHESHYGTNVINYEVLIPMLKLSHILNHK
jgi:hypothetical protein